MNKLNRTKSLKWIAQTDKKGLTYNSNKVNRIMNELLKGTTAAIFTQRNIYKVDQRLKKELEMNAVRLIGTPILTLEQKEEFKKKWDEEVYDKIGWTTTTFVNGVERMTINGFKIDNEDEE